MQNIQKMRYPEGKFRSQFVQLVDNIHLASGCYLTLLGTGRILSMCKGCHFNHLFIQIERFLTVEVKCVSAIILFRCLELSLLTTCSQPSVCSNYLLSFLLSYAEMQCSSS